ncbi:hypothetical protein GC207_05725 [bacterium]|nr:hypothetical protein [bacterium]
MFWKKNPENRLSVLTDFGEFIWDENVAWICECKGEDRAFTLMVYGRRFDVAFLPSFARVLENLQSLVAIALAAAKDEIVSCDQTVDKASLDIIGIDPKETDEDFQFVFGFANWPDGGLTVHFKNDAVIASHIDD